ncbi:7 transmembrane receptor (rhodopsin family) [Nesidiocoris tenuis]|uniref:7 transmembrane receptor (Rhodopsin family) n=1 Tax=Nesidiocoris tenuis TaxID=355587 RepID=A0ABN7AP82_9HEMI|nr:7 transmembrane receptor (rhodopsin family) [Nesidiocoris tenuis]
MLEALMPPAGYVAASVILFFIGFIGFFANLTVIVLMCRDQQLWTPLNCILFNLIMSDFSVSILGNPFTLASAIAHRWLFGHTMCIMYGFFMALLGITSISTLTALAIERYLIISRPLNRRALSRRSAVTVVAGVWVYSLTLTVPPLMGWGEYGPEAANISCSVNWEERTTLSTSYIIFLFIFGFFVPLFVICYSYINIIFTMKENVVVKGSVTKAESRVAGMIFVMIFAFFIAWTPYAVLTLLIAFANEDISPAVATIPAIFAKTSICYNPIIYVGLNTQFRKSWRSLFGWNTCSDVSAEVADMSAASYRKTCFTNANSLEQSQFKSTKITLLGVKPFQTETAI